ncbi:S8 family serine peptidase [Actinomadura fibrosa]|uniref:S8 family serine peptidase n=1 Tax=Actinomadura fibrosa TaxID=111802 RepID=A0ABW2XCB4_9ACTN|nr:S8 family serine peptidase [Actinomadura fibrosa]
MTHRPWSRALLGALLAGGALAVPPTGAAHAAPAGGSGGLPPGRSWTVTLLTGDVVRVRTVQGRAPMVATTPAPGRDHHLFRTVVRPDGHVLVTPVDVAKLVGRVIDPELFDVTALIGEGYDDARSTDLPLIVQREGGVRAKAALGGSLREGRVLPSISAVAARQPKKDAGRLGSALAGMGGPSLKATGGIKHVWLDGRVKASTGRTAPGLGAAAAGDLDRNLAQIGAPAAWKAGFTGRGAKVAVLDTGVDTGHPDLKGRIAGTENFSDSADTADRVGHGTHVAATIAGTGAAAGGERKGVAPDAGLLVGKVLGDDGSGSESQVIAGMEWAARQAKVVNMSLGGGPTDGTDPMSQALDRLSDGYGALFVVAAGNDGSIGSVGAPGTADAALTVGAVDGADRLAGFSSRGPRAGRYAAKPEIVAPGVDIVAARAEGTAMGTPQDALYTAASGTSMATPHVAGAAALLAARYPDLAPARLKAALTSTTGPASGGDAWERGTGRLDAATAVTAPVTPAEGVIDLGTAAYPSYGRLTAKLAWDARSTATHLDLSVRVTDRDGREAAGVATLSASQVDVPVGGGASAILDIDASKLSGKPGLYTAEVTAKGGGATVRTLATFYVEPRTHTLTLVAKPLPDTDPADFSGYAEIVNVSDIALYAESVDVTTDGTSKYRVPEGRYSVLGTLDDFGGDAIRSVVAGTPEILVDRDLTLTMDGTSAKRVNGGVEGTSTTATTASVSAVRALKQGLFSVGIYSDDPASAPAYALPMGKAQTGTFRAYAAHRLTAPGTVYDIIHSLGDSIPADPSYVVAGAEKARLARVDQRFAAFDGDTGKSVGEKRYGTSPEGLLLAGLDAYSEVPSGTTRTDYHSTGKGMLWSDEAFPRAVANGQWVDQAGFSEVPAGNRTTQTWGRQPLRPGPYSGSGVALSFCAPAPTARTRGSLRVQLVDLQTRPDGFDCGVDGITGRLALYSGGKKLGEKAAPYGDFTIPAGPAAYRLTYDNDASAVLPVSVRTSTAWTFRSAAPDGHASANVPLLTVDYDLGLDLRNQPAGAPATFTVARVAGSGTAKVTGFRLWTSVDDGATWRAVRAKALGGGRFGAPLPAAVQGQAVSLRVAATDAGGSGVDQRIIRAYRVR